MTSAEFYHSIQLLFVTSLSKLHPDFKQNESLDQLVVDVLLDFLYLVKKGSEILQQKTCKYVWNIKHDLFSSKITNFVTSKTTQITQVQKYCFPALKDFDFLELTNLPFELLLGFDLLELNLLKWK